MSGSQQLRGTKKGAQPPNKSQCTKILSKLSGSGRSQEVSFPLGHCADSSAPFLAFDYRGLYHFVLTTITKAKLYSALPIPSRIRSIKVVRASKSKAKKLPQSSTVTSLV